MIGKSSPAGWLLSLAPFMLAGWFLVQSKLPGDCSRPVGPGGDFRYCKLQDSDFSGRDLSGTDFRDAILVRSNFSGSILDGTDFSGADLSYSDLTDAAGTGTNFAYSRMSYARLDGTRLKRASFHAAVLAGSRATGMVIEDSDLDQAGFEGAELNRVEIRRITGRDISLRGASIAESVLQDANLRFGDVSGAAIRDSRLERTSFYLMNLDRLKAERVTLIEVNPDGEVGFPNNIVKLELDDVCISGATLPSLLVWGIDAGLLVISDSSLDGLRLANGDLDSLRLGNVSMLPDRDGIIPSIYGSRLGEVETTPESVPDELRLYDSTIMRSGPLNGAVSCP
jgi:uncharacterized protein YjbI with pentapeptide repeats